jgi:hypothetical protein
MVNDNILKLLLVLCKKLILLNTGQTFPFPVPDIQPAAHYQTYYKNNKRYGIYQLRIEIDTGKFQQQEMYIGAASIVIPQPRTYIPVPLRAKTITPSVPDAQYKPRESRN